MLNGKKVSKARDLLSKGRSVKETAMELGYYDEFHFSKEFKRFYGQPPKAYKRG